ncbi:sensor histidine kinase [Viridibacillus arvi]|uniref:sensor histidine kinase n=1 Tax=Viridibacillus arvi TaxID=263475 RepID=UPI00187B6D88|nr:histidine kinase [Viridibacillus sp. JNUCC-6]QOV12171.1 sensor histidine kinase [Viridibacillus sp. JNUCC-6]
MQALIIRYIALLFTIGVFLIHILLNGGPVTNAIVIATAILCLYFTIPLSKIPIINYLIMVLLIPIGVALSIDVVYLLPLYAFFIMEGAFQLKHREHTIYISSLVFICIAITLLKFVPFISFVLFISICISSYFVSQLLWGVKEKSGLYTGLLGEYRTLKRSFVEQEQLARAEERTKMARDIHDSVGHKLTALLMQLEVLSIENNMKGINDIKELARDSLDETRNAVRQLKTTEVSGIQSVIQLIRKLEMESHLQIRFTFEKGVLSLPISNRQSIVLYRVLQESLTNAMKYSDSKEVEVILRQNSLRQVHFIVKNKVLKLKAFEFGFGLTNMMGRVEEIGGELRVNRTEDHFIVEGTFPIKERE